MSEFYGGPGIIMKARYELKNMNITLSNVTLREASDSYVLLKATDANNNEVKIIFSHGQAEFLEGEFQDVNRRRKGHNSDEAPLPVEGIETDDSYNLFNIDSYDENKEGK
jgi:hypothetical protein